MIIALPMFFTNTANTMSTLRAIIVEDNKLQLESLAKKIQENCPLVSIVDRCRNGEDAITSIQRHQPDLVFLDVVLGTMEGFQVLDSLQNISFEVIFTTGYPEHMQSAIRANALDYLLKPIDVQELIAAVNRIWSRYRLPKEPLTKVPVHIENTIKLLDIKDISYCRADDNTTFFHFLDRTQLLVKRTLKDFDIKLPKQQFFRIHRSYLINREHIDAFDRTDGGFVTMRCGKKLSVSPKRIKFFLAWLGEG